MNDTAQEKPRLSKKRAWILRTTLFASIGLLLYSILAMIWSVFVFSVGVAFFMTAPTRGRQIYDYAYEYIPTETSMAVSAIAGCVLLVLFFILRRKFKKGSADVAM